MAAIFQMQLISFVQSVIPLAKLVVALLLTNVRPARGLKFSFGSLKVHVRKNVQKVAFYRMRSDRFAPIVILLVKAAVVLLTPSV